jgi:hypothetical protein
LQSGEQLGHRALELLARDVADVLGEPPAMAERVGDLPVALAPEGVGQRLAHLGTGVDCALPDGVHVVGRQVQHGRRAADAEGREHAHLRELIGQHHRRGAEPDLQLHQLAAGHGQPAALLRAEHRGVPLGRGRGVPDDEVRRDREGAHALAGTPCRATARS